VQACWHSFTINTSCDQSAVRADKLLIVDLAMPVYYGIINARI